MKKRIISLLLVLVLFAGMVPATLATPGNNLIVNLAAFEEGTELPLSDVTFVGELDGIRLFELPANSHGEARWEGTVTSHANPLIVHVVSFAIVDAFFSDWNETPISTSITPCGGIQLPLTSTIHAYFAQLLLRPGSEPDPQPPQHHPQFIDVPLNAWFHDAVDFVSAQGIMTGTSSSTFAPNANFSREMVVATLFRMYHGRAANTADPRNTPFTDVDANRWYAPYIAWAFGEEIVTGTSPTTFGRGNPVSRQDFAVIMYRFANFADVDTSVPNSFALNFPDANRVGSWAQDALTWAVYSGLITGTGGQLEPIGTATRAQAATILMRYVQNT